MEGKTVRVRRGDSIPSLALEHGFFNETLWNHLDNAELKRERQDQNILMVGDEVFIPALRERTEEGATSAENVFKRRGVPYIFKLHLKAMGQPRADQPYRLDIDGTLYEGITDADGLLEQIISPDARRGILLLRDGEERHELRIGHLNPIEDLSGVKQRLNNLGFDCQGESDRMDDVTTRALTRFQTEQGLEITGTVDDATKARLQELHP